MASPFEVWRPACCLDDLPGADEPADQYWPSSTPVRGRAGEASRVPHFSSHPLGEEDALLFAGGPVWALAWAPGAPVLAVSAHRRTAATHVAGERTRGHGMVQLWRAAGKSELPELLAGLTHDGDTAWDLGWCPNPGWGSPAGGDVSGEGAGAVGAADCAHPLGLLAASLASGELVVWAVPPPGRSRGHFSRLAPAASTSVLAASGPCRVHWNPALPHDRLLVGCQDGSVAVVRVAPSHAASPLQVLVHFPAQQLPLRFARWAPPNSADPNARYTFGTAGSDGTLQVWDARSDAIPPALSTRLTTAAVTCGAWSARPLGVLTTTDDGALRGVPLDAESLRNNSRSSGGKHIGQFQYRGSATGALWAVDVHPSSQVVAYGGEDGVVGAFLAEYEVDNRRRSPHTPLAAFRLSEGPDGAVIDCLLGPDLGPGHGLYSKKPPKRDSTLKGTPFTDDLCCVTALAWASTTSRPTGAQPSEPEQRLAIAGRSGLVRVLTVYGARKER